MMAKRERSFGITLLALSFLWIGGLGSILFPLMFLAGIYKNLPFLLPAWPKLLVNCSLLMWYLAYVAYLIIGIGLWKLRDWARRALQAITILSIAAAVVYSFFIKPVILVFPLTVCAGTFSGWMLWYTMRPRVKYRFTNNPEQSGLPAEFPPSMTKAGKIWTGMALFGTFGLYILSLLIAISYIMRQSDVYKMALADAENSQCVANVIGKPVVAGWFVSGNIQEANDEGSADLSIAIKGPTGKADLGVSAERAAKVWTINELTLTKDNKKLQLIPADSSPACP